MNPFFNKSELRYNGNTDDIVYYSEPMDAIIRITREQFLADNPGLTEQDYQFYKDWSDANLLELCNHDRTEGRRHSPLSEGLAYREPTLVAKQWPRVSDTMLDLAVILTPTQYRRLMLHVLCGLTEREIAKAEGCKQQVVSRSILSAKKKLEQYFTHGV